MLWWLCYKFAAKSDSKIVSKIGQHWRFLTNNGQRPRVYQQPCIEPRCLELYWCNAGLLRAGIWPRTKYWREISDEVADKSRGRVSDRLVVCFQYSWRPRHGRSYSSRWVKTQFQSLRLLRLPIALSERRWRTDCSTTIIWIIDGLAHRPSLLLVPLLV